MGSHVVHGYRHGEYPYMEMLESFLTDEHEDMNLDWWDAQTLSSKLRWETPLFLIAVEGGRITGIAAISRGATDRDSHVGMLRLHVRAEYRSNGVGRKLLQRALWWADRHGIERLVAMPYVQDSYLSNARFFLRHGFEVEGYQRRAARLLDGSLTDVALMARVIQPAKEDT